MLKAYFGLLLLSLGTLLHAQYQDFRTWWNIDLSTSLTKDLDAGIEFSQRFNENSLLYDRTVVTGSLAYDLANGFDLEAGLRYLLVKDEGLFESRYRLHAGLSYQKSFDRLQLSLRERYQYGYDGGSGFGSYYENKSISRSRVKAKYDIFGSPFAVHLAYELFIDLNSPIGLIPVANRYVLGLEYNLHRAGEIDLSYLLEDEINVVRPLLSNILVLTYKYDF